jgi:hypothetical protein
MFLVGQRREKLGSAASAYLNVPFAGNFGRADFLLMASPACRSLMPWTGRSA